MMIMTEKLPINHSGGLTSIKQLIDSTANELFSFSDSSSATERFVIISK